VEVQEPAGLKRVEAPEPTRPAEPEFLESKTSQTPTTASKKTGPQWERAERYIKKHYPAGTDGVSTTAIHDTLAKDPELLAEIKEKGSWGVPSMTVINRVLGRREK
jgi:hypothetical protein